MNISFDSKGGFEGSLEWLKKIANKDPTKALESIGESGVKALSSNTPRDTGQTASGWNHKVSKNKGMSEVAWINNAHPESSANVAVLIDKGHGTRNGGYVPPKPFIKKSMDEVYKTAGDKLAKELIE